MTDARPTPDGSTPQPLPVLVAVKDLIFGTRIHAAAKDSGIPTRGVRDAGKLKDLDGRSVIVDLGEPGMLEAAAEWKRRTGRGVVGFVSHVDTETIRRARELGLDDVLPRSAFVVRLPELLIRLSANVPQ
jgi:hypothetical protein